jgi:hypothetical protein
MNIWTYNSGIIALALGAGLLYATAPLSAAEGIGGKNEKPLELEGRVVDLVCEVAGRCLPDCGGGKRQLGLKLSDGKLIAVIKNPGLFTGAVNDLAPFCGKTIYTDGLLFENPKMPVYQVQGLKADRNEKEYKPVDGFIEAWVAKNGPSDEWFRADPLVKEQIARNGPLGRPELKLKAP